MMPSQRPRSTSSGYCLTSLTSLSPPRWTIDSSSGAPHTFDYPSPTILELLETLPTVSAALRLTSLMCKSALREPQCARGQPVERAGKTHTGAPADRPSQSRHGAPTGSPLSYYVPLGRSRINLRCVRSNSICKNATAVARQTRALRALIG